MLQHVFKLMLRMSERKAIHPAGGTRGLRAHGAHLKSDHPTGEFLTQVLRSALAQRNAERRGGRVVQHSPKEPPLSPPSLDAEQPDGKVVRLVPRRRSATEQVPNPPSQDEEDNDPGPPAA